MKLVFHFKFKLSFSTPKAKGLSFFRCNDGIPTLLKLPILQKSTPIYYTLFNYKSIRFTCISVFSVIFKKMASRRQSLEFPKISVNGVITRIIEKYTQYYNRSLYRTNFSILNTSLCFLFGFLPPYHYNTYTNLISTQTQTTAFS